MVEMEEVGTPANADKQREFEEVVVENQFWKPTEKEETIEGEVIGEEESKYGRCLRIKLDNDEIAVTPAHKVLQTKLQEIKQGDFVRIRYDGEYKAENGTARSYTVWKAK